MTEAASGPARLWPARLDDAVAHLRGADPVLAELIDSVGELGRRGSRPVEADDHYGALVRSIVGQQLSAKAAHAINARLLERFDGRLPTPGGDPGVRPRGAACRRRPVARQGGLPALAGRARARRASWSWSAWTSLPDDEVIAELVAVKGIGEWTAHMFLMFHLQRPDVLAVGDLGVRRPRCAPTGLEAPPKPAELEAIAEAWRPHRTRACLYLWRSLENAPV